MILFMKSKLFSILLTFSFISIGYGQNKVSISGYIRERSSGEMLSGATILLQPTNVVTNSNSYGFYSLTIQKGLVEKVFVNVPGFYLDSIFWDTERDTFISFGLTIMPSSDDVEKIDEVNIVSKKSTFADKVEMSKIDIPVNQIKDIPALFGEKDVLKVIQLLPGVQKGGEGQSGIYVRGGGPDQNLLILDEATVYNASHLFGFFSVFNGDALRSVELTKGGFPARYGGRLSSVIDLNMKEGNNQKYTGEVGVGLISSRFTFEGPIKKGKSSFMISGRRTYIDLLIQPIIYAQTGGNGGYYFYDMNAKFNYILSERDKLYLSGYFGRDNFYASNKTGNSTSDFGFGWGNRTVTGRWNHQFNSRLFSNLSVIYSHYDLSIDAVETNGSDKFSLGYVSDINDYGVKYDFDWRPNPNHLVRYGFSAINHQFNPSAVVVTAGNEDLLNKTIDVINTYESGIYVEDQIKFSDWKFLPGLRLSQYSVDKMTVLNPEPRFSASFNWSKSFSIKGSYAMMNQYIHLLSNSGIGLPTDLWIPATEKLKPMNSEQYAFGIAKDLKGGYSVSFEYYNKRMLNIVQYKEGASFLLQDNFDPNIPSDSKSWESQVTSGQGHSQGCELFIQKQIGKLSGWIGYTLSWTILQFDELNGGKPFYAKYDRRHDASVVAIYKIDKNFSLAATWVYGTGNAITMPQGSVNASAHQLQKIPYLWDPNTGGINNNLDYGNRNDFRMEAYHRLDLSFKFMKEKERGTQTWELSIYNAYSRANPFFYYGSLDYVDGKNVRTLKKITLFPIIPSISWSFKFK
jgi:hypothetical protein